ncbi:MAG: hypothetical protein M3N52_07670, partial [Actinomycetota bacterium]|nr:hypothetical protein [Actinomycetota bacterium]
LYFVGATSPRGHLPTLLTGTARLAASARRQTDLVVVDTCGFVDGVAGQSLKFHQLELAQPRHVIGLQHGEELEPLLGIARRFTAAQVTALPVHPGVVATSAEQRAENRRTRLERYFAAPLPRFVVRPTTFMPSLPAGFDLSALHGILVGLADGRGGFLGVGVLEHADGTLRCAGPVARAPSGLRLGSARVDEAWRPRSVDLRGLLDNG